MQTRIVVLGDAWDLLKFFNDDEYAIDPKAAAKELGPDAGPVLDAAIAALDGIADWTTAQIENALKSALIEGLALKPRKAFGPIRVAATGHHDQPAVVRVAGAAGPRSQPGPAAVGAGAGRAGVGVRRAPEVFGSLHGGFQRLDSGGPSGRQTRVLTRGMRS